MSVSERSPCGWTALPPDIWTLLVPPRHGGQCWVPDVSLTPLDSPATYQPKLPSHIRSLPNGELITTVIYHQILQWVGRIKNQTKLCVFATNFGLQGAY